MHSAAVKYSKEHCRIATLDADVGEPLSARKIVEVVRSANNYLGYKSRQQLISECWVTGIGPDHGEAIIAYCQPCPVYGFHERPWLVRLMGKTSDGTTGTWTVFTSRDQPRGLVNITNATPNFTADGYCKIQITIASSTYAWSAESEIRPYGGFFGGAPGLSWLTVVAQGANLPTLGGISVVEAGLADTTG